MIIVAAVVLVLEGSPMKRHHDDLRRAQKVIADVPVAPTNRPSTIRKSNSSALLPSNGRSLYYYDRGVVVKVDEKNKVKITELFAEREAETEDHPRVIAKARPQKPLPNPASKRSTPKSPTERRDPRQGWRA